MQVQKLRTHPVDGPVYLQRNSPFSNTYLLRISPFEKSFSCVYFSDGIFAKMTLTPHVYVRCFQKQPVIRYEIFSVHVCVNVKVYGFRLRIPDRIICKGISFVN